MPIKINNFLLGLVRFRVRSSGEHVLLFLTAALIKQWLKNKCIVVFVTLEEEKQKLAFTMTSQQLFLQLTFSSFLRKMLFFNLGQTSTSYCREKGQKMQVAEFLGLSYCFLSNEI